ncbi:sugar (pentulose or hexulose) kinase [Sinorhizobium medicae]
MAADRIFVIGGGAGSALWRQMIADASGLPVIRSLSNEASALGAGMSAAIGAGWYGHFGEAAGAMSRLAEQIDPRPAAAQAWAALSRRQANLYQATRRLDAYDGP